MNSDGQISDVNNITKKIKMSRIILSESFLKSYR